MTASISPLCFVEFGSNALCFDMGDFQQVSELFFFFSASTSHYQVDYFSSWRKNTWTAFSMNSQRWAAAEHFPPLCRQCCVFSMWQSFLLKWLLVSAWLVPGKLFEVEVVTLCILHTTVRSHLVLSLFPSFGFLVFTFSFVTGCGQLKYVSQMC